jgi:putative NADPH-quinone reductase
MAKSIVIIQVYPDVAKTHLCHALAAAYAEGAEAAGHTIQHIDVADLQFPMLRLQSEFDNGPVPSTVVPS